MTKEDLMKEYQQRANERKINVIPANGPQIESYTLIEFIFEKVAELTNKIEHTN